MIFFDVNSTDPTILPIDDTVGIKRIILTGELIVSEQGESKSGIKLLLAENNTTFLTGNAGYPCDFTFSETPYGYPAPSCFLVQKVGSNESPTCAMFVETSPFVNADYFERKEGIQK